jgi:cellulose synthase/poly-beta-1,6-N-acetylglucosamine synthase-like glycosyltransferase
MVALLIGSLGTVTYVFLGYPALVALIARVSPRPVRTDPTFTPRLSLVIAAHNEEDFIAARLRNVAALDYPADRLEVLVVTDGSDDDTPQRAAAFPGVRVLHEPDRRGKLAAMNRGAAAATGDVVVFSDANNHYPPETLRELVAPLADPNVGLVTGRKVIDDGTGRALDRAEGLYWRYESKLKEWESASGSVIGAAGEVLAFRREAFPWHDGGLVTEDFVLATMVAMAGWRVVYAPHARSIEHASATIDDEAVRRARLVTGRSQAMQRLLPDLLRRHPRLAWQVISHKALRPLVPCALICGFFSNILAAKRQPRVRMLALAQLLFYGAALRGWRNERRGTRPGRLTYLPFYFCRMNLSALDGVRNFMTGRYSGAWTRVRRG